MVEGLTCFRLGIRQIEKSTVVFGCRRFFVFRGLLDVVTYPPAPLPFGDEEKGVYFFERG